MPVLTSKSASTANGKPKNYAPLFEKFGCSFVGSGPEVRAEACPTCGGSKFGLNTMTGQYRCLRGSCGMKGNVYTFLGWVHDKHLQATTSEHYASLKMNRGGISSQTLKRHELAFDAERNRWLIPFRDGKGKVVNILLYDPTSHEKRNLPGLPTALFNLNNLSDDPAKIVYLCEGPFDALALDYALGLKRAKYDIIATPGAFQEKWCPHFRGRKVRALYDNDKGGDQHREGVRKLLGESKVAADLRILSWPPGFDGCDINDLVSKHPKLKLPGFFEQYCIRYVGAPKLLVRHGWERVNSEPKPIEWIWPNRLRTGTYASFSGVQASLKSTIVGEMVARYTTGRPMPGCDKPGMPPGHVLIVNAEDDADSVWERLETAGADLKLVSLMPATLKNNDPLNLLEHLEEMKEQITKFGTRLVVIDGQNSVVGAPDISTDMKGRFNVTNRLHQFAQRLDIALLGVRNEDSEGRALGSQSMADLGRCVMRAVFEGEVEGKRYYTLVSVKVSDAAPNLYPPIPYSVEDLGGRRRKILWEKAYKDAVKAALEHKKGQKHDEKGAN